MYPQTRRVNRGAIWLLGSLLALTAIVAIVAYIGPVTTISPILTAIAVPSPTLNPPSQTAVQSVTVDAATRIVIAAHSLEYTTPKPVEVLQPTDTPDPASPTATLSPAETPTIKPTPVAPGTMADIDVYSPILDRTLPMRIYLPPNYDKDQRRYPVLYMLHGGSASYKEWTDYGLLSRTDEMIRAGQVTPYIIVLPMGEMSYWVNHANGGPRWADYLATDIVGYVDAHYRTINNPQNRAIGGLSMGAYGALEIGFMHPEIFKIVGADSLTLRPQVEGTEIWGTDPAYYNSVDPLNLAKTRDLTGYKIWLDVGKDDPLAAASTTDIHNVLVARGIPHTWNLFPGAHERVYWASHVLDYSSFYAHAFTYK